MTSFLIDVNEKKTMSDSIFLKVKECHIQKQPFKGILKNFTKFRT